MVILYDLQFRAASCDRQAETLVSVDLKFLPKMAAIEANTI